MAKKPGRTRLSSKRAKVMQTLWQNKRASNNEIRQALSQRGAKVSRQLVNVVRAEMRNNFPEENFSIAPKPIELTTKQKKLLPQFRRLINWRLRRLLPSLGWDLQAKRDFAQFARSEVAALVSKYDAERGEPSTFVANKLPFMAKSFIRERIRQKLGFTKRDVEKLFRILKLRETGMLDGEIAEELKISQSDVAGFLKAYGSLGSYLRSE